MSSTISHHPPKDDEEEEDEEQGEEFMFDDSTDEEKAQEDITLECITPVGVPKPDNNEASGAVVADDTQLFQPPSPAGPESIEASCPTTDVPAAESPNEVSAAPAAAEPGASDRSLGEELPVVPPSDSGDRSKEAVQGSSDSRDISEEAGAPETSLEVIYDDVPSEEPLSPDEDMIYEDVQRESGPLEANNGWSSSEFESYDEQSDNDAKLPARSKVQQLMRAARTGTKDGLERTKIAVMRKVSFLQRKDQMEEDDDAGYLDVAVSEVKHPPPQLSPMPEGLTNHQVQLTATPSSIKIYNSYTC